MKNRFYIILICLQLFSFSAVGGDRIPILYFYEADCPDCEKIDQTVIPGIMLAYGDRIKIIKRNIDQTKNFEAMMAFETKYNIPPQEVPEFYTAFGTTWKPDKISKELPVLIEKHFKPDKPGQYHDFLNNYLETGETGISVVESIQKQYGNQESEKELLIYEFRKPGCRSCNRLSLNLKYLKKKFPGKLAVETFNIKDNKSKILNEALCIKYGVEEKLHMATPALFFGERAIVGEEAFKKQDIIRPVILALGEVDKQPTKKITPEDLKVAEDVIYQRFEAISWVAVLGAGLLDGVNPCAFVTIIFLLSYLALMKYSKKDIAFVGLSFTLAVFLTYLAIGLGFLKFVEVIQNLPFINEIIYYIAIALALIIGLLNFRDYYKIRKGSLADMDLKLSDSLRQRINALIRKNVKLRHYVIGAFGMGFAISLLELACTGQVYLPTILFIINTQGMELRAVLLLVGYNLAFILPLIIIFTLFWHGSTEKRITQWLTSHGSKIKLAMGLLFICLAFLLFFLK